MKKTTSNRKGGSRPRAETPLGRHLLQAEKAFIVKHLRDKGGNVTHTADALGVSHRQLCRMLKTHGITRSDADY